MINIMAAEASNPAAGVTWDLSALFSSPQDPKINETWAACHAQAEEFAAKYRGRVQSGELTGAELAEAMKEIEAITLLATKPPTYASLLFAADASNPQNGAFYQAQSEEMSMARVKLAFFDLELQAAPQEWIEPLLADPALASYVHAINVTRVYSPHRLSEAEEILLEETSNTGSRAWVRLHDEILSNHVFKLADPDSGEVKDLSQEEVLHLLRSPNRALRQAAADSLSAGLGELNRVIVFIYNTLLADKKLEDRLRRFGYPEQSRHMANELSEETVDLVADLCRDNSGMVARYYKAKQELLGLPELTHVDRYAPLFEAEELVDWPTAREMVHSSFQEFHPTLAKAAQEFFDSNWIDAEVRKGKTGGAFCSYITPDLHPVILMSYQGKIGDVMTLAHELGHGVHASVSRVQTPFNFQGTLPLAELASIFAEMLVFDKVIQGASVKDQAALYADKIEGIFASVHRQASMYRFEKRAHRQRRESGELTKEEFAAIYQEEMQSMFQDSVHLGEQHGDWWSYISHFFFAPFYVYAYSFGELLTLSLFQRAKNQGPGFAEQYLDVLQRGGSETPQQLMGRLGVDLTDREFWQEGFDSIDRMVAKFEDLKKKLPGES
jgi:oligoendopeptidase F